MEGIATDYSIEAPKTEILDLPVEVRDYLMSFLDYSSRRTCRLVCHTLKESVDGVGVGISIKIDDRQPESIELCGSLNATEVQIQHMLQPVLNLNFKNWRAAILSGPIDSKWLNAGLQRNCPNLRVLILTGDSLTSQDFIGSLDLPIFQHLTQLRLSNKCSQESQADLDLPKLDGNMSYLLKSIRSRVLRFLDLFGCNLVMTSYEAPYLLVPYAYQWKRKALFDFIETHCNSLEEVNTTNLGERIETLSYPIEEAKVYQIPKKLKQFCWRVEPSSRIVYSSFWKDLLLCQESLERLCFIYADATVLPLGKILFTNSRTLTSIILHLKNTPVLNMSLFSTLEVLQKMKIDGVGSSFTKIINLNQLPRTRLTSLQFLFVKIEDDFDGIEFMDGFRPETLKLMSVRTSGLLNNRHYLKSFITLVLRCRSLNVLVLKFVPSNPSSYASTWCEDIGGLEWINSNLTRFPENVVLNFWLSNLSAQCPMNHFCTELNISDIHDWSSFEQNHAGCLRTQDSMTEYTEKSGGVNIDYLELIANRGDSYIQDGDNQEQPFNFPRNAESYTIWRNLQTNPHFRILPNFQPYTMRVNELGRIRITLKFIMEESVKTLGFRPVSLANFKICTIPHSVYTRQ